MFKTRMIDPIEMDMCATNAYRSSMAQSVREQLAFRELRNFLTHTSVIDQEQADAFCNLFIDKMSEIKTMTVFAAYGDLLGAASTWGLGQMASYKSSETREGYMFLVSIACILLIDHYHRTAEESLKQQMYRTIDVCGIEQSVRLLNNSWSAGGTMIGFEQYTSKLLNEKSPSVWIPWHTKETGPLEDPAVTSSRVKIYEQIS